jgi:hypothetical protein
MEWLEGVGVTLRQPLHVVDLLEHRPHGVGAGDLHRDVDRPELPADPAAPQPRDVGVHRGVEPRGVGREVQLREAVLQALADLPGDVVVAVDERDPGEEAPRPLEQAGVRGRRGGRRGRTGGGESQAGDQGQKA